MSAVVANGRTRIAQVMVALGPKRATPILRAFPPEEIEAIAAEIAAVGDLDDERSKQVLLDFARELVTTKKPTGDLDYAVSLLAEIFGPDQAQAMAARIDPRVSRLFGWLDGLPPADAARSLRDEPAATIAVALVHLDPAQSAKILRQLEDPKRSDVALRMAGMQRIAPDVVAAIDASLRRRLAPEDDQTMVEIPGVELVVEMLNQSPAKLQKQLIEQIREKDTKLATRIQDALFVFEDILKLDNRAIQEILKNADSMDLALALKDGDPAIAERIFANLSERAAASLGDEIDYLSTPKPAEQKAAKGRIVATIRQLEESGAIEIARPVADEEDE